MNASEEKQFSFCLLLLRWGIAIVFVMWIANKLVNPDQAKAVFGKFYGISLPGDMITYVVAGLQSIVLIAFILGAFKTYSYMIVLIMHAASTFSSFKQYLDPWTYPHLLFFAAIPMLASCILLWRFRKYDTILSIDVMRGKSSSDSLVLDRTAPQSEPHN